MCVFLHPTKHVVKATTLFQCALLIEVNAYENEWFVTIEDLQEGKRKGKKATKKVI